MPHDIISLVTRATSTLSWILGKSPLKPKRPIFYSIIRIGLTWHTRSSLQEANSWSISPFHQLGL